MVSFYSQLKRKIIFKNENCLREYNKNSSTQIDTI